MPGRSVTLKLGHDSYFLGPRHAVCRELHASLPRQSASLLDAGLSDPGAMRTLLDFVAANDPARDFDEAPEDREVLRRAKRLLNGGVHVLVRLDGPASHACAGPAVQVDAASGTLRPDLAITAEEESLVERGDIRAFWLSRLHKLDPVARIGFGLWSRSAEEYRAAIERGNPEYWDHKSFAYWEGITRTTIVNLSVGLNKAGFRGNMRQEREKIRKAGEAVANWHVEFVKRDYKGLYGRVPGLLSAKQIADYHHMAFAEFGIQPDNYGGTWLRAVPDDLEFRIYGFLYCHDCDSDEGYPGVAR